MPRLATLVAVLLALLPAGLASQERADIASDLTVTDKIYVATQIHSDLITYFGHWSPALRQEFEAAYRRYVSRITAAQSRRDFDLDSAELVASVHNGHTRFTDDLLPREDRLPMPFTLVESDNGAWLVAASALPDLRLGDRVISIDRQPIDAFLRDRARYVAASNARMAISHVPSSPQLFPLSFELGLEGGRRVRVSRTDQPPGQRAPDATETQWLVPGQIGYIRIPSFNSPDREQAALDFVRQAHNAKALILDLRGNGGGATPFALLGALMDRPSPTWNASTPEIIPLLEAQGAAPASFVRPSRLLPPRTDPFGGQLYVLVDRYTGSAAEDAVMPLKITRRATILGETTQGSSGQPYRFDLGNGMRLSVGTVHYTFPDGTAFEGVGIAPDIEIQRSAADIAAGRDAVLARARSLAER